MTKAGAPLYLYEFDHPLSFGPAVWGDSTHCYTETCHAGELPFLFNPVADVNLTMTPAEVTLTAAMQRYWVMGCRMRTRFASKCARR